MTAVEQIRSMIFVRRRELRMLGYRVSNRIRGERPKVFGIGLSRTGTKSLDHALAALGYRSDHFSTHLLRYDGTLSLDMDGVKVYDALTDITVSPFYRELDAAFPGSKFILTVRDPKRWLASCREHFPEPKPGQWPYGNRKIIELRKRVYGVTSFEPETFLAAYEEHALGVKRHFAGRPNDLLVFDVCAGLGWRPICDFLGKPEPKTPFPWANRLTSR